MMAERSPSTAAALAMSPQEAAIARSVLFASLFDYPLTLAQLRQTLIESTQTPSQILAAFHRSASLRAVVESCDGYFYPAGRADLLAERRRREARSRAFLATHRPLLRIVAALPYVRMVALSGSIAHLNLERHGDLDLFIVTRGSHVWSTTVIVVLLAKALRRRRTLCANFVVSDKALVFDQQDLFTASQIVGLRPLTGGDVFGRLLEANPFVRRFYPNFHPAACGAMRSIGRGVPDPIRRAVEWVLGGASALLERVCRWGYRTYLRSGAKHWESPDQVRLDDDCLKLHTRSHRGDVLMHYHEKVRSILE